MHCADTSPLHWWHQGLCLLLSAQEVLVGSVMSCGVDVCSPLGGTRLPAGKCVGGHMADPFAHCVCRASSAWMDWRIHRASAIALVF